MPIPAAVAFPAVASAVTATAGIVADAVKARKEAKAREKEVQRVEKREDTAISRGVQQSLAVGVDPRKDGQPAQAGATSVQPQQLPDYSQSIAEGVNAGANLYSTTAQLAQQNEIAKSAVRQNYNAQAWSAYSSRLGSLDQQRQTWSERLHKLTDSVKVITTSGKTLSASSMAEYSRNLERNVALSRDYSQTLINRLAAEGELNLDVVKGIKGMTTDVVEDVVSALTTGDGNGELTRTEDKQENRKSKTSGKSKEKRHSFGFSSSGEFSIDGETKTAAQFSDALKDALNKRSAQTLAESNNVSAVELDSESFRSYREQYDYSANELAKSNNAYWELYNNPLRFRDDFYRFSGYEASLAPYGDLPYGKGYQGGQQFSSPLMENRPVRFSRLEQHKALIGTKLNSLSGPLRKKYKTFLNSIEDMDNTATLDEKAGTYNEFLRNLSSEDYTTLLQTGLLSTLADAVFGDSQPDDMGAHF